MGTSSKESAPYASDRGGFEQARVDYWLSVGAQVSDRVSTILRAKKKVASA